MATEALPPREAMELDVASTNGGLMSAVLQSHDAKTTLVAWRARDAEVRERATAGGLGGPEQFAGKSVLEIFQAGCTRCCRPARPTPRSS